MPLMRLPVKKQWSMWVYKRSSSGEYFDNDAAIGDRVIYYPSYADGCFKALKDKK